VSGCIYCIVTCTLIANDLLYSIGVSVDLDSGPDGLGTAAC
jgi:hypothetical protein